MYMKICYHDIGQIIFHQHEQENNGLTLTWPHHHHHYQSLPWCVSSVSCDEGQGLQQSLAARQVCCSEKWSRTSYLPYLNSVPSGSMGKDNFPSWKVINSTQRGVPRVDPGTENIGHKGSFSFSGDHFQPEQIKLEKECPLLPQKDKPHLELYGFMSLTMSQSSDAKPLHHNHYSSLSKSCFSSFLIIPDRNASTRNRAEKARTYNSGQAVVK